MKINEIVNEGIGTGLLKLGAEVSQYFDPALASKLEYALTNAKPIDMSKDLNLQRFADIVAKRANANGNQISAQSIYQTLADWQKKSASQLGAKGPNYTTPESRVSAVKSVIQDLQRRGIKVITKQKPVYKPTAKEPPYYLYGKKLNPNDPNDRTVIDKFKAQQGIA
jgi:hypothetical protein